MNLQCKTIAIKLSTCLVAIGFTISSCSTGQSTYPTIKSTATFISISTPSQLPALTSTSIPPTATPKPEPGFEINGKPFKFLGAFVPGYYWGEWSKANDLAIITQAKKAGITVFHLMLPQYEKTLGTFDENELKKLDDFLDVANQNDLYVIITFTHGLALATQTDSAFSNPGGVEGLIHQPKLRAGFKDYMAKLITRINSINSRRYSEDATILSWTVIDEIVSAPPNYPTGFPNVTVSEIADWLQENAAYIKSLDPNHLVSLHITPAIDAFDSLNQDWRAIVKVPALDFVEAEDGEARILYHQEQMYTFDKLFALNKPVVIMLSYTGGGIDRRKYCNDYKWQADTFRQVVDLYLKTGAVGFIIFSWRANQNSSQECYSYNLDNTEIVTALNDISSKLGELNASPEPLDTVGLTH